MKSNVTEEDYVSGYKIKQQIKQKNSFRSIFHAAVASIKLFLLSFHLMSNDFGQIHSAKFFCNSWFDRVQAIYIPLLHIEVHF